MEEAEVIDDDLCFWVIAQKGQDLWLMLVQALEAHKTHRHSCTSMLSF
jgi:hypothetical protein